MRFQGNGEEDDGTEKYQNVDNQLKSYRNIFNI